MTRKREKAETPFVLILLLFLLVLLTGSGFAVSVVDRVVPTPLLTVIIVFGLVLVFLLALYFIFFIERWLVRLHRAQSTFIESDINPLKVSISELSRGNLSIRAVSASAVGATPGAGANATGKHSAAFASRLVTPLFRAFDELAAQIRESTREFNGLTETPCRRLFYVGADSYREGKMAGEAMDRLLKGKGKVAIIKGSDVSAAQSLREKGFQAVLVAGNSNIEIAAVRKDDEDSAVTPTVVRELIESFPDLAGIYVTQGSTPQSAAQAVIEAFPDADTPPVKIITHDLTPGIAKYLARGVIAGSFSQNPFAQGYDPVILLYNYLVTRQNPVIARRHTPLEEITPENCRQHWDDARGSLVSEKAQTFLARPLENKERKPFTIAVILPDDSGFWEPVAAGVRKAAETLAAFGTTVKPVLSEAFRKKDWSAAAFIPVIRDLIDEGSEAISLPVFDRRLVPFINRQVENGIAIATYNSEPLNLRGMIDAVSRHAAHLFKASEDLAAGATQNTRAINQISATMKLLLIGSLNQIQHLSRTDELVQELTRAINRVKDGTAESIKTADETKRISLAGYEIVRDAQAAMTTLGRNSQTTTAAIRSLNDNVMKINEIIAFIEDIAARTNLLAINASIQAAQAGGGGKGFGVVAAEIRTLAEQAGQAAADITGLIRTILAGVDGATTSVMEGMEQVRRSVQMADRTEAAFREITNASAENEDKVGAILAEAGNMLALSAKVKEAMTDLIELNRDNDEAMDDITTSVTEMTREIDEIGATAQLLKDMGRSQEDLFGQFILE